MAIDKKNSPVWYKVVVWIILIGFVLGFVVIGATQIFGNLSNPDDTQTTTASDSAQTIDKTYQAAVAPYLTTLKSSPDDFDANNNAGQIYLAWAQELDKAGKNGAQQYKEALPYLKKAYGLKPDDQNAGGNYASALYLTGDTAQAVTVGQAVVGKNPDSAQDWYNLGLYLAASNEAGARQEAITAFRTAIEKDTSGTLKTTAQQQIDTLNKAQ